MYTIYKKGDVMYKLLPAASGSWKQLARESESMYGLGRKEV